jgi:hypothetical protein
MRGGPARIRRLPRRPTTILTASASPTTPTRHLMSPVQVTLAAPLTTTAVMTTAVLLTTPVLLMTAVRAEPAPGQVALAGAGVGHETHATRQAQSGQVKASGAPAGTRLAGCVQAQPERVMGRTGHGLARAEPGFHGSLPARTSAGQAAEPASVSSGPGP